MTNYPTSLDNSTSLPNPADTDDTTLPASIGGNAGLARAQNALILALETALGIPSSGDVNSAFYQLQNVTGGHSHTGTGVNGRQVAYSSLSSVPATFAPTAHTHSSTSAEGQVPYTNLSGIPATFAPASHAYSSHSGLPATADPTPHSLHGAFHSDVDTAVTPLNTYVLAWNTATGKWVPSAQNPGGTGAPTSAGYLTTAADGGLSNEVVVGVTPGGELAGTGSTWASPKVTGTHAGSAHHTQLHAMSSASDHSGVITAAQHGTLTTDIHTNYIAEWDLSLFSIKGDLSYPYTGTHRIYVRQALTVTAVRASVGTASAGGSVVLDVLKNGVTTLFTTPANRPTIGAGTNTTEQTTIESATLVQGDYLTVNIVTPSQSWSGTPADLTVQVFVRRT